MKLFFRLFFCLVLLISFTACNPLNYFSKNEVPAPATPPAPVPTAPIAPSPPVTVAPSTPTPPPAAAPVVITNNAASIIGDYSVRGTNPGGRSNYSGSANITAGDEPNTYKIHWRVGTVYDGIGKLEGNTFNVKWGTATAPVGTVIYTLEPGGVLKGVWYTNDKPNLLGSEILTPR